MMPPGVAEIPRYFSLSMHMPNSCTCFRRQKWSSYQKKIKNPILGFEEPRKFANFVVASGNQVDFSSSTRIDGVKSRAKRLRELLSSKDGILLGPAVYDGISAKLTEQAGFDFAFMSGFSVAGARLGFPDTGLLSSSEVLDAGRCIHEATKAIPIIGDGDTGYGNAMNVKRTVRSFADVGFAGILIEDQVWPKSCGHVRNKRVVDRKEAVMRIRAACDARDERGDGIVIVARTDARQAISFDEALWRVQAFIDEGADVVFIDALESVEEMQKFCMHVPGAIKMASLLEGGGKTPVDGLNPSELESMGFKLVAYPLSLLGVTIAAQQEALQGLRRGILPPNMPNFKDLQEILGFNEYFEEEDRYSAGTDNSKEDLLSKEKQSNRESQGPPSSYQETSSGVSESTSENVDAKQFSSAVEADQIFEPDDDYLSSTSTRASGFDQRTVDLTSPSSSERESSTGGRSEWLRIRISDARTKVVKLDTRFPAGFLGGIASIIPQVAGLDLEGLVRSLSGTKDESTSSTQQRSKEWEEGMPILSFDSDGDLIEIFLEKK